MSAPLTKAGREHPKPPANYKITLSRKIMTGTAKTAMTKRCSQLTASSRQ